MSKHIHMIGIGGIGMSALAQVLNQKHKVTGSDLNESDLIDELRSSDIHVNIGHKRENAEGADWIIYSEAIPKENPERIDGVKTSNYFEALGELQKDYPGAKLVAVAGTHGKSTTVSMLASCLIKAGIKCSVIVGTKMKDFDSKNFFISKNPKIILVEACEYRENFLPLKPELLGITNIDFDHPDYFKSKEQYTQAFEKLKTQSDAVIDPQNYKAYQNELGVPGKHNLENAGLAFEMAMQINADHEQAYKEALKDFKGAWRRFERVGELNGASIISDYAHHPKEIQTTLETAREQFPGRRILAVFQVHQHSRAIQFLDEFRECFTMADYLFIPDIYSCRDSAEDKESMSAEDFAEEIQKKHDEVEYSGTLENTANIISQRVQKDDAILLMGAGNIDQILKYWGVK